MASTNSGYSTPATSRESTHPTSSESSYANHGHAPRPSVADPTVIVGMAARVPGASNVNQLWKNLAEKKDLRREIPQDRFNIDSWYHPQGSHKGTTNARYGYFLDQGLDEFDAPFFNISGKEAEAMDPQQRLLLEVVYEAFENAGITLERVNGSRTSVYCGSFTNDYNNMTTRDLLQYPKYTVTGIGNAILSNRISYCFNLHGPSMTLDTACSSSLVCLHLGSQSIQTGESEFAVVAGSALHFDPTTFVTMTDFGMLSSDGRCRTFDSTGSGYVRGEGVCAVVLRKKSAAEASGDPIRGIIRGIGSNHDGLKDGLTLPNGEAQATLVRQVYRDAGISTEDTHYFESHGTGTPAGDPREARAIGDVFSPGRTEPLIVGSIKSNLGHLEGASGLAGVIKATLSVESGKIMPNMHFDTPNPQIDFDAWKIRVPIEVMDWKSESGVRRASVNSFGYGGSNAHCILENHQPKPQSRLVPLPSGNARPYLLPLSSHTEKAGKLLISTLIDHLLQNPTIASADLAWSYSVRRSIHSFRSFAVGHNRESFQERLTGLSLTGAWTKRLDGKPRLGFVFTGQGAQWHAMGRQLLEQSLLFRQSLERCDNVLRQLPDAPTWSCVSELLKPADESQLHRSLYSQPLCTALQLGILELLQAWGVRPSAVIGHSSGEIAAAHAAGILSFDNAIICAYYRGVYMSRGANTTSGAMMAVGMTELEASEELKPYEGRICIAAINSPSNLTLSGDAAAILELKQGLDERKVFARQLKVEQAFHSHHMDLLAPAYESALSNTPGFQPKPASCPMFSSVTARDFNARKMDPSYWATNMTNMVRFSDSLTGMVLDDDDAPNVDVIVEIGAHPVLRGPTKQTLKSLGLHVPYIASLSRDEPAYESLLSCAGHLFAHGYPVDLRAANSDHYRAEDGQVSQNSLGQQLDNLPTYSWDHARYWAETRLIRENRQRHNRHALLGAPMPGSSSSHLRWRNYLRQSEIPWVAEHRIDGKVIFPAAGYIAMAIEAISTLSSGFKCIDFRDIMFKSALPLSDKDAGTEVTLDLDPQVVSAKRSSSVWFRFLICSYDDDGHTFEHCHGLISATEGAPEPVACLPTDQSFASVQPRTNRSQSADVYYKQLRQLSLEYDKSFQLLTTNIESAPDLSMASMSYKPANVIYTASDACVLHPTLLDSSFHAVFAAVESSVSQSSSDGFIPTFVRSMSVSGIFEQKKHTIDEQQFWVKTTIEHSSTRSIKSNIAIQAERSCDVLVDLRGLELTALGNEDKVNSARSLFFRIRWMPAFSHLSGKTSLPELRNLGEVLDLFAHQFPDSRILHITPSIASTRAALSRLGGSSGERRRFHSFAVLVPTFEAKEDQKELEAEWPGLIQEPKLEENEYDLVIVSEAYTGDLVPVVRKGGFMITENADLDSQDVTLAMQLGVFRVYKKAVGHTAMTSDLALLMAPGASAKTMELAAAIKSRYVGAVTEHEIGGLIQDFPKAKNIVSLVNLDEDLFYDHAKQNHYDAVRTALTSVEQNIVWILQGSSQECAKPAQALTLGLIRALRSENETTRIVSLDVPMTFEIASACNYALAALDARFNEEELAIRDDQLLIPRIEADDALNQKLPHGGQRQARLVPFKQKRNLALKIGKVGLLDTLHFEDDEDTMSSELGDDDVEIEVKGSALNFRDLAASIGIIDDDRLGDECSGVIIRTGRNVTASDFKEGDRVLAWRPGQGAHRSVVRNPAVLTQKLGDMDFVTAAAFSCVLVTAYYSLKDVARLQAGEFCLIHSAAGGVGQMAVQVAQMVGAQVIATVGSQEKRDFIQKRFGLPDSMVFSSRDASFVDGVLNVTNGRGCDVALNSLAGELLHATWKCIAPFGRLVEIGKRDIHENAKLDMDPFRKNISYASVDLVTMFDLGKDLGSRLLRECYELVQSGRISRPEPVTTLSYAEAQKGFRLLQLGKHIGKIVLVPDKEDVVPVTPAGYQRNALFDPEKEYLLVGGLGGIGRALSEWMVRRGARRLAFLSRSGANRPDAQATIDWLVARNIHVDVFKADVTDLEAVGECVQSIGSRLAGVFQAAMVLQDAPFSQMTIHQWTRCLNPKVRGTYNLHQATLKQNLDFFVCFSSGSSIIGAIGQANYSAANAYLDALMRYRQEHGLPGASINIGRVTGVGVVAEDTTLQEVMDRMGYDKVSESELFYQIEEALSMQSKERGTEEVDKHQLITGINLSRKDVYWATKSLFRNLYANHDFAARPLETLGEQNLRSSLQKAPDVKARNSMLMEAFVKKITTVLSVPISNIEPSNPLSSYGLDSIVAIEFRKWFSKVIGVELTLFDVLKAASIQALVSKVIDAINTTADPSEDISQGEEQKEISRSNIHIHHTQSAQADQTHELMVHPRPEAIPLSSFQTRLWYIHNLLEDKSALNIVVSCSLNGQPQLSILQQAVDEVVKRNDTLRTYYFEGDDFSQQAIYDEIPVDIQYLDFSKGPGSDRALREYAQRLRHEPLDIEGGQMIRPSLVRLDHARYTLLCVAHHIALDNGSTRSIMGQITSLYEAIATHTDTRSVAAPRISYLDFAVWHNKRLASPQLQSDIAWWKETLHAAPGSSKLLPFAKAQRPSSMSSARSILKQTLAALRLKRLKRICSRMDVTPFQFMLAGFRSFLYRYTEEDDIVILMADGNRPHTELEDVLGFFVNMVPLRLRNGCEGSFDELVSQVKQTVLNALDHSQVNFDAIVSAIGAESPRNHFPLSQIIINYQMYGKAPKYKTTDFEIDDVTIDNIPTACDLNLEILEIPDAGLELSLEYDSHLYGEADVERFFENFVVFIESTIKDFRQPIEEIEMCGPKEIDHLRSTCWSTELQLNDWDDDLIWTRIAEAAHKQPAAIAIDTSDGDSVTYMDLVHRSECISSTLLNKGARVGQLVGILADPDIDMIAAMMGITRIRCGYVPLDPAFATGRLTFMIEDSASAFLLIGSGYEALARQIKGTVESLISIPSCSLLSESSSIPVWNAPQDPFCVIYTSGSTGKPKGVVQRHSGQQAMLSRHNTIHTLEEHDVFLCQSSMSFDMSVPQIWGALTSGARLALASKETRRDSCALAKFIKDAGVTITYATPTQLSLLLEHDLEALRVCQSLRRVIVAGETATPRLVKAIYNLRLSVSVCNQWGTTEVTAQTVSGILPYPQDDEASLPIGKPFSNCSHYILDKNLKPVPKSVIGEICAGGVQVCSGYLNRPDATAASFIKNPFASEGFRSKGWTTLYRTGDKGRFRQDGSMEFHGRISGDQQIKIRGFRINLGEIENALQGASLDIDGVRLVQAVVIPRDLHEGQSKTIDERQLIAFIVLSQQLCESKRQTLVDNLHQTIKTSLNDYMLPSGYQCTDTLPKLVSGKLDRQALLNEPLDLLRPAVSGQKRLVERKADSHDTLQAVTQAFKDVLKLSEEHHIADDQSFFDLGGHSVLLLRLKGVLKRQLKVHSTLVELIEEPTPSGIAKKIAEKRSVDQPTGVSNTVKDLPIDWDVEITLLDEGRYRPHQDLRRLERSEMNNILLTGVETFAGLHLLRELLVRKPSLTIHLLGSEKALDLADILEWFGKWNLFHEEFREGMLPSRIKILKGSLQQPHFGLHDDQFAELGQSIQAVIHAGGHVSLLKTYSELRRANVVSVLDLIELASLGTARTEFHYLSTWSVAHLQAWSSAQRTHSTLDVSEAPYDHFRPSRSNKFGYFKSRWVAEMLLEQASRRGLPVSIYRSSAVAAPLSGGSAPPEDSITHKMIMSMLKTGKVPSLGDGAQEAAFDIDFIPVDYLATVLVGLSLSDNTAVETTDDRASYYHIGNPSPLSLKRLSEVMAEVRDDGKAGEVLDVEAWMERVRENAGGEAQQLEGSVFREYLDLGHRMFSLDATRAKEAIQTLRRHGEVAVECPPIDVTFLKKMLERNEVGR